jgi:hypothetical protein
MVVGATEQSSFGVAYNRIGHSTCGPLLGPPSLPCAAPFAGAPSAPIVGATAPAACGVADPAAGGHRA